MYSNTYITLRIDMKIVSHLFDTRFARYSSIHISTLFVSPSSLPHYQRNSCVLLFYETLYTHILPHAHSHICVSLLRGRSSVAHRITRISMVSKLAKIAMSPENRILEQVVFHCHSGGTIRFKRKVNNIYAEKA